MNSRFIIIAILIFIKVIGMASRARADFSYKDYDKKDYFVQYLWQARYNTIYRVEHPLKKKNMRDSLKSRNFFFETEISGFWLDFVRT